MKNNRISLLIFSKNRAFQLDCLLRSIQQNCAQLFNIDILFTYSNNTFCYGYKKLINSKLCDNILDWEDSDFNNKKEAWMYLLHKQEMISRYQTLMTDDCIFYRKTDVSPVDITSLFEESNLLCFSFRAGFNNVIQNYLTGQKQTTFHNEIPVGNNFIRWDYTSYPPYENKGYPWFFDGATYRVPDLIKTLDTFEELPSYRCFEGALAHPNSRNRVIARTFLASFRQSHLVNVPVNQVQDNVVDINQQCYKSPEELNEMYLDNYIVDLDETFKGVSVIGEHQAIELKFKKN